MNNFFFMVALLWATSLPLICSGQQIATIEWNYDTLYNYTSSPDFGNFLPINECEGIINFGSAKIALINYESGNIISFFDEEKLKQEFINLLSERYGNRYSLFSSKEQNRLPYCQRQRFIYQRFYEVKENLKYASEIVCIVKNNTTSFDEEFRFVIFVDKKLKLLSIFERDNYNNGFLSSVKGGFFIGEDNFFIKKVSSKLNMGPSFAHFKLEDNIYRVQQDLEVIKSGKIKSYFPGRHFSNITLSNSSIIYNEAIILNIDNILNPTKIDTIKISINTSEIVTGLRCLKNKKLVGMKNDIDEEGISSYAEIFIMVGNSSKTRVKKSYEQRYIRINSFEVYDNNIIILLFDSLKRKYLIETLSIE